MTITTLSPIFANQPASQHAAGLHVCFIRSANDGDPWRVSQRSNSHSPCPTPTRNRSPYANCRKREVAEERRPRDAYAKQCQNLAEKCKCFNVNSCVSVSICVCVFSLQIVIILCESVCVCPFCRTTAARHRVCVLRCISDPNCFAFYSGSGEMKVINCDELILNVQRLKAYGRRITRSSKVHVCK